MKMKPVLDTSTGKRSGEESPGILSVLYETVMRYRAEVKFLLHLGIFTFAYCLAYLVRFDFVVPSQYLPVIRKSLPVLLAAKAVGFLAFGLFRGWWRYVSIRDVFPIAA